MSILFLIFALQAQADGSNVQLIVEFGVNGRGGNQEPSLVVFDDRQFVFQSSSGGWGRCKSPRAGRFKGKLSETDHAGLLAEMKNLDKACAETGFCQSTSLPAPRTAYWVIRQGDGKANVVPESPAMPKLIGKVLDLNLQQEPLAAVELSLAGNRAVLKNIGAEKLTLPRGVFREIGKGTLLHAHGPESKALKPGESVQYTLSGLAEGDRIEYDNSTEAHHFDEEGRVFLPCVSVEAGKR